MRRRTRFAIIGGAALAALAWGGNASADVSDPMAVAGGISPGSTLPVLGSIPQPETAPAAPAEQAPVAQVSSDASPRVSSPVLSVPDEPATSTIIPPKGFLASLISACEMALHVPGPSAPVLALILLVASAAAPVLGRRLSAFRPLGSDLRLAREVIAPG